MKPIRIFRHVACEGPGSLQNLLQQHGFTHELIAIDQNTAIPSRVDDVSGLVFMGGPMSVNDPLSWIEEELQLIRTAVQRNVPVLGICLGSQLIAKALGARVYSGPCMEIGWLPIEKTHSSDWTNELPQQFHVFHWHGETFDLPKDAQVLLKSERFAHQAFAIGPHLALQFHVEVTAPMVGEWLDINAADLQRRCYQDHDRQAILSQTPHHMPALEKVAGKLLGKWLSQCKK